MRMVFAITMFVAVGCSRNAPDVKDCMRSALASERHWEERSLRWLHSLPVHREEIDKASLEDMLCSFSTNGHRNFKCAVPLFVKFSKDRALVEDRSVGRLVDLRGNADYSYGLEMVLFGDECAVLSNRMYFCYREEGSGQVVVWSRRLDNVHAWSSPCPTADMRLSGDIGVFSVERRGLCPVFLGDEGYGIEQFLRKVLAGSAELYWWCGQWCGLCEGKHVYDATAFGRWVECNRDFIVPMRLVFSVGEAFIFSADPKPRYK